MNKLTHIYNAIQGRRYLSEKNEQNYTDVILPSFLKNGENYLFYDDISDKILLLNEVKMREQYQSKNYREYGDPINFIESFEDFCASCCIEVLKSFNNYSVEEIKKIFENHTFLKFYLP